MIGVVKVKLLVGVAGVVLVVAVVVYLNIGGDNATHRSGVVGWWAAAAVGDLRTAPPASLLSSRSLHVSSSLFAVHLER